MSKPTSQILYELMLGVAALTDIVGDRIFQSVANETTTDPWVVMQRIDAQTETAHSGQNGIRDARYQLSIHSADQFTCEQFRDALIDFFDAYSVTLDGERILVFHVDDRDLFDEETKLYCSQVDLEISRQAI